MRRYPIPDALWERVEAEVPLFAALDAGERSRLRQLTTLFLQRKRFFGAHGMPVTDHMRVLIAAQACLLILNLGPRYYRGWQSVVLYETGFVAHHQFQDDDGILHEITDVLDGEASLQGPVALSWAEIAGDSTATEQSADPAAEELPDLVPDPQADADAHGGASNLVLHEFAHKLDYLNGDANGCPPLHPDIDPARWKADFLDAYRWLCERVEAGLPTPVDPYAAENPAEFFAVTTESFFLEPERLQEDLPTIYAHLRAFYRQDPARRNAA